MKSFDVNIYALINPINNHVFYVGCTKLDVSKRLLQHMYNCDYCDDRKSKLIDELKNKGLKAEIILLETVLIEHGSVTEEFYYNLFMFYGFDLFQSNTSFNYTKSMKYETEVIDRKTLKFKNDIVAKVEENKKKTGVPIAIFFEQAAEEKLKKQSKKKSV